MSSQVEESLWVKHSDNPLLHVNLRYHIVSSGDKDAVIKFEEGIDSRVINILYPTHLFAIGIVHDRETHYLSH